MKQIDCNVKRFRIARQIPQREIAEKCNVSIPAFSRLERGLAEPGVLLALRVAEVLDCGVRELWPSSRVLEVTQGDALKAATIGTAMFV